MTAWNDLAQWLLPDVQKEEGFWYSHPILEIQDLSDEDLFWVPDNNALCILWHVGHIAHREADHMQRIIRRRKEDIIPSQYQVFGTEWHSVEDLKKAIDSTDAVCQWVSKVRQDSKELIASLTPDDFNRVTDSTMGLTIGHWVFLTVSHGALHIGKIQVLRNMLNGIPDNPC